MDIDLAFVDSISASATVRLDLTASPWGAQSSTSFGMAELRRATTSTLLTDGDRYPAAAYSNRVITLVARVVESDEDAAAASLQLLYRELDRPTNILRYRPGTSEPVFFRTFRAPPESVMWDPFTKEARASIPAEPFALGLRETLPQVTVYQDPAAPAVDLNANPYFETDAATWSALGGTVARSTAQFHQGVASLLLTPDGASATSQARSEIIPATAGTQYVASSWVRCAVARTVDISILWRDAGGALVGPAATAAVAVAAGTWAALSVAGTAPAGATQMQLVPASMGGTPPISHTLHIDEARLRQAGGPGAGYFDVASPKGDVETPLFLRLEQGSITDFRQSVIAVRRRGNPSAMPLVMQAETMTLGVDTALGAANDAAMSGAGQNYLRVSFGTQAALVSRASIASWPPPGQDARGLYRVFLRVRQSSPTDVMTLRLRMLGVVWSSDVVTPSVGPGTAPDYVDMGLVQLPTGADPVTDGYSGVPLSMWSAGFSVEVGRTSGTGTLDIDHLLLVPADDRLCIVDWPVDSGLTALVLDSARTMVYAVGAAGEVRTPASMAKIAGGAPMVSPSATNRIVFVQDTGALQNDAVNRLTSTTQITPYYWPRYLHVRGAGL